ncbi:MAG: UDP-3-O-(3-hydroxymyristoyl)glucosamine N-acyltransferase [Gemmatimonadaceae bacterium]
MTGARPHLTARDVARLVGGTLVGEADAVVESVAPLDRARSGDLSMLAATGYVAAFARSGAGVVLVSPELADTPGAPACRIVVGSPHEAMLRVLPELYPEPAPVPGVHPSATIGRGARFPSNASLGANVVVGAGAVIGERVWVGPNVTVGDGVSVGSDSRIYPSVILYPGTQVGERARIHGGACLGSDGFGYVFADGAHQKMPHVGRCIIENDVEIGANTTVDRGSMDDTVIGAGTKIDNLVQIAHNVRIGRLCLIMSQVGIAGSAMIGDGCILAGQAGLGGHITIGAGARIAAQSGVFGNVPPGETWSGYPARPHKEALRAQAALFKLSGMMRKLERLVDGSE